MSRKWFPTEPIKNVWFSRRFFQNFQVLEMLRKKSWTFQKVWEPCWTIAEWNLLPDSIRRWLQYDPSEASCLLHHAPLHCHNIQRRRFKSEKYGQKFGGLFFWLTEYTVERNVKSQKNPAQPRDWLQSSTVTVNIVHGGSIKYKTKTNLGLQQCEWHKRNGKQQITAATD